MQKNHAIIISIVTIVSFGLMAFGYDATNENKETMNTEKLTKTDHSLKRILARGCDPTMTQEFGKMVPALIGNPEYVGTSTDEEFLHKIKTEQWSVVFFAPGACRFSQAQMHIPGGNSETQGWSIEQYKELIIEFQGKDIQFAETPYEQETIQVLKDALEKARNVK